MVNSQQTTRKLLRHHSNVQVNVFSHRQSPLCKPRKSRSSPARSESSIEFPITIFQDITDTKDHLDFNWSRSGISLLTGGSIDLSVPATPDYGQLGIRRRREYIPYTVPCTNGSRSHLAFRTKLLCLWGSGAPKLRLGTATVLWCYKSVFLVPIADQGFC